MDISYIVNTENFWGLIKLIGLIILMVILRWIYDRLISNEFVLSIWNNENVKWIISRIKDVLIGLKDVLIGLFFLTVIVGIFTQLNDPSKFPLLIQLAAASLSFGTYSIGVARLLNLSGEQKLSDEAINHKHIADNLLGGAIYFVFAYFFGIAIGISRQDTNLFWQSLTNVYSIAALLAIIIGIMSFINGLWRLFQGLRD